MLNQVQHDGVRSLGKDVWDSRPVLLGVLNVGSIARDIPILSSFRMKSKNLEMDKDFQRF